MELETLLLLFKSGNHKAMEYVFNANYNIAYAIAQKIIQNESAAEDIVLECFVKLFDMHKEVDNPRSFLFLLVKRTSLNYLKSNKRAKKRLKMYGDTLDTDVEPITDDNSELITEINQCIKEMPHNYQQAFKLIAIEGKRPAEIAEALNMKAHAAQVRYCRAIQWIKNKLKNKNNENRINQSLHSITK